MASNFLSDETYHLSKKGKLSSEKVVRISVWKAAGILLTAMLGSAGVSFWGGLNIAASIPGRVSALEKEVVAFEKTYMPLDLASEKWKNNDKEHESIEKKLDVIEGKIDTIRNLIK